MILPIGYKQMWSGIKSPIEYQGTPIRNKQLKHWNKQGGHIWDAKPKDWYSKVNDKQQLNSSGKDEIPFSGVMLLNIFLVSLFGAWLRRISATHPSH